MNKWKIAFWVSVIVLILVSMFTVYLIIDQSVTLSYQKEGYTNTENDLESLITIINKTDLSKPQINEILKEHKFYEFMDFKNDTVSLERVKIIFENNRIKSIIKEW